MQFTNYNVILGQNLLSAPTASGSWKPEDPNFIGCWWLGYIISAVAVVALAIPMWFFPKTIEHRTKNAASGTAHSLTSAGTANTYNDRSGLIDQIRKQLRGKYLHCSASYVT
jgi:Organic Anion Transporter Polypeptide (OATP) family